MSAAKALLVGVAVFAAAYLISKAADAAAEQAETETTAIDYFDAWGYLETMYTQHTTQQASQDANVRAFIDMIAQAEGTASRPDPYRVCFGYKHTIQDLSDHPAVTGEWRGEKLSDLQCAGAGLGTGCVSTAAGKGQLIKPTWLRIKRALGLKDFGPESQDAAITYLIDECGALEDVKAGRVADAVTKCRKVWASFPGAGYAGQGSKSMSSMVAAYQRAGGALA